MKDVKKKVSRGVKNRKLKKGSSEEDSDTSQCGSDSDEMGDKVKSRKEAAPKRNIKKSEQRKKRKISENADVFPKKPTKLSKRQKEEDNNSDEDGNLSEDNQSQSSGERSVLVSFIMSTPCSLTLYVPLIVPNVSILTRGKKNQLLFMGNA